MVGSGKPITMLGKKNIFGTVVAAAIACTPVAWAQGGGHQHNPAAHVGPAGRAANQGMGQHGTGQQGMGGHKAGEWLRKYHNLPAAEQEKMLKNDPEFQKLPPEKQEHLLGRLKKFNEIPPEQQEKVLNRMQTFENLTPEQRDKFRKFHETLRQMPPERSQQVREAFRKLRQMSPEEQDKAINSDRFRQNFNEKERGLIDEMLEAEGNEL